MKHPSLLLIISIFMLVGSCSYNPESDNPSSWKVSFEKELVMLGHRNWILVLDKAFPEQTSEGITYYYADEELLPVLKYVLGKINSSDHISPVIFTDLELEYLNDDLVSGIGEFITRRKSVLGDIKYQPLLHEEVFKMLDDNAKLFRTIAIKTNCTLPYTSFFIRLDCGYWNTQQEGDLRKLMGSGSVSN